MPLRSRIREWLAADQQPILEAKTAQPKTPDRSGYEYGIPDGGLNEYNQGIGVATQTDRRSLLEQLYEAYVACPWAWACVQVIAKTITAGGLVTDWDSDTGEGDQEEPEKPAQVLALERLLAFVNPQEDIRQLMRNVITDLLVFGDAFLEIVWWGSQPVALYSLDCPSMMPQADAHGTITGYVQITDFGQRAEFDPRDVIHISLDAPRSGIYGISPTQAALLPITAWLFAASCGKEMFRKGLPPQIHADFPAGTQQGEMNRWAAQYQARNIGPRNIGAPILTKGGAKLAELQSGKAADVLAFLSQKRDEIIADYGCYPAKVGVIESGNLGGGTAEGQDKALDFATMIPTPTGWTTMGELSIGDVVLDENGKPCNVLGTTEVPDAESWRLVFSDGTHIDCCSDHLWTTWTGADRQAFGRAKARNGRGLPDNWPVWRSGRGMGPRTRRTAEILATLRDRRDFSNHSVPVTGALQLPDAELPIKPYTLGAWLGDGTSIYGDITCAGVDEQVIDEVRADGYEVTERASVRKRCGTPLFHVTGLRTMLRHAGLLGDKHVPSAYLRASAGQRLALLQGLMDTDGGFSSGQQVLFRNTNERLADAVVELARSLGQKPVKAKGRAMMNGVDYGPQYGVTWTPTIQVFRLARKAAKWKPNARAAMQLQHRMIVDAIKIPDRPMRCIRVDSPNRMYLAGEAMIPTHNSFRVNTCQPIAELLLEKINFAITRNGFGIEGWKLKFGDVDWRDSLVIEQIRDMRLRNGSWKQNKYRADIGEPPIDGGDDAVLVDRQNMVLWADMSAMSKAIIASKGAPAVAAGEPPPGGEQMAAGQDPGSDDGKPAESLRAVQYARYRARLAETMGSGRPDPVGAFVAYREELGDKSA